MQSGGLPPPPPPAQPLYATQPQPPRKSSTALVVVVVVVVVILVLAIVGALAFSGAFHTAGSSGGGGGGSNPPAQVDVTAINFAFNGATNCWTSSTGTGDVVSAGQTIQTTWTMSYNGGFLEPNSCTIQSVSVQTSGFSIQSTNTPLVVLAHGTQTLTVVLGTPGVAYTGVVTLDAQVTSP